MEGLGMIDIVSYILGLVKGKAEGASNVIIEGEVTCADDGNGNITITEG